MRESTWLNGRRQSGRVWGRTAWICVRALGPCDAVARALVPRGVRNGAGARRVGSAQRRESAEISERLLPLQQGAPAPPAWRRYERTVAKGYSRGRIMYAPRAVKRRAPVSRSCRHPVVRAPVHHHRLRTNAPANEVELGRLGLHAVEGGGGVPRSHMAGRELEIIESDPLLRVGFVRTTEDHPPAAPDRRRPPSATGVRIAPREMRPPSGRVRRALAPFSAILHLRRA